MTPKESLFTRHASQISTSTTLHVQMELLSSSSPLADRCPYFETQGREKEDYLDWLHQPRRGRPIILDSVPFFLSILPVISPSVLSPPSPTATALTQPSSVFWTRNPDSIFSPVSFKRSLSHHSKRAFSETSISPAIPFLRKLL